MKTYVPREGEIRADWWVVNAEGVTLGRLATEVARRSQGKHKPGYTPVSSPATTSSWSMPRRSD